MSEQTNPLSPDSLRQSIVDEEHLRLLSIGYVVSAGMNAFFSLFGLMYAAMGLVAGSFMKFTPPQPGQPDPPVFIGWIFSLVGVSIFVIMVTLGVLKLLVWRRLKQRRSRIFCMVVAALSALSVPYGTVLCIFTFLVLSRPSVSRLFEVE
jgi:hypothetical protein